MRRPLYTILFLLVLSPVITNGQIDLNAYIGGAVSYVSAKNLNASFNPVLKPNASIISSIHFTPNLALQLGIGYSQKGYNTEQTQYTNNTKNVFITGTNLQYLSLPLLASYRVYHKNNAQFWVDAGMDYNLFLQGNTTYDFSVFENGDRVQHQHYKYGIIGRYSPSKFGPTENSYDVNGLDATLRLQVRYSWKRYTAMLYYERGLYDMRAMSEDATSHLSSGYAGMAVGYKLF